MIAEILNLGGNWITVVFWRHKSDTRFSKVLFDLQSVFLSLLWQIHFICQNKEIIKTIIGQVFQSDEQSMPCFSSLCACVKGSVWGRMIKYKLFCQGMSEIISGAMLTRAANYQESFLFIRMNP